MSPSGATTETLPSEQTATLVENARLYELILFNDDDHSYQYVIEMLGNLFGLSPQDAFSITYDVDFIGQAVVKTCPLEEAMIGRDQIHNYGPDHRLENSSGSMRAAVQEVGE
ncbi:ATP-dependent Clp protease adaptor ClpS [Candidatus Sumerlaeota bacterium]|nr:ATP-dependent Clp protease adaptor ClpS [Candidatus Sumerlaeota bacterium]